MGFSKTDIDNIYNRYTERYNKYGFDHRSLGWERNNQEIRFGVLSSQYIFENKSVLDIGCGFGDFNRFLKSKVTNYKYWGIDLIDLFINEAKIRISESNILFEKANILEFNPVVFFDYAVASGIFNYPLNDGGNYEYIEAVIEKTISITNDGLAFDFLSDRVDFKKEGLFYNNPERILSIAYKFSKKVILRNDYFPFEFSLFIFKDQTYNKDTLTFNNLVTRS